MRKREYLYKYDSPIGRLDVLSDGENITGLWIRNMKYDVDTEIIEVGAGEIPVLKKPGNGLTIIFLEKNQLFYLPLNRREPSFVKLFGRCFWKYLMEKLLLMGILPKK